MTWKEVCAAVGINASTAAYQRNKFIEFIPSVGEGHHRRYSQKAVEVLSTTSKLYAEGKTYEDIKEVLEHQYGAQGEAIVSDNNPPLDQPNTPEAIRSMLQDELAKHDEIYKEEFIKCGEIILDLKRELMSMRETLLKSVKIFEDRDQEITELINIVQKKMQKKKNKKFKVEQQVK